MGLLKWAPLLCKKQLGLGTKRIPGFTHSCSMLGAFVLNVKANPRQIPRDRELSDGSAGPPAPDTQRKAAPGRGSVGSLEQLLLQLQRWRGSGRLHHLRSISSFQFSSPAKRFTGKFSIPPELRVGEILTTR